MIRLTSWTPQRRRTRTGRSCRGGGAQPRLWPTSRSLPASSAAPAPPRSPTVGTDHQSPNYKDVCSPPPAEHRGLDRRSPSPRGVYRPSHRAAVQRNCSLLEDGLVNINRHVYHKICVSFGEQAAVEKVWFWAKRNRML